jgi:hypothetical protein
MRVHVITRIDNQPTTVESNEILLFMNVRNEHVRLPHALNHYRKLGVTRFFVTDNGSSDGSKEFLLAQPDCHVFVTYNSYAESKYGVEWQNALLNEYGMNHWCLMVDADEWFIYPGYERKSLSELTAYLDEVGSDGMFAFLLDMYGYRSIAEPPVATGESLLNDCPYFDAKYTWYRPLRIPRIQSPPFPEYNVFGGPRLRMLFPYLHRHPVALRAMWRIADLVRLPLPARLKPAPSLSKVPLVRWRPGISYNTSHRTTPIRLSNVTGVLMHFKYLHDFRDRVVREARRKEHSYQGGDYARYLAALENDPALSFYYTGSAAYEGSDRLVRMGLLREDQGWARIRAAADLLEKGRVGDATCPDSFAPIDADTSDQSHLRGP